MEQRKWCYHNPSKHPKSIILRNQDITDFQLFLHLSTMNTRNTLLFLKQRFFLQKKKERRKIQKKMIFFREITCTHLSKPHSAVWINEKFSLTKKFRQINNLVISLVKPLLSRNFCEKIVRENFHTAHCGKMKKFTLTKFFSVKSTL